MKTLLITLLTLFLISGCVKEGKTVSTSEAVPGNDFSVQYLFTVDSVKIYRFMDDRWHYIAIGPGKVLNTEQEIRGKNYVKRWDDGTI